MSLLVLGHTQVVCQLASTEICFCVCAANVLLVLTTKEVAVGCHCQFS